MDSESTDPFILWFADTVRDGWAELRRLEGDHRDPGERWRTTMTRRTPMRGVRTIQKQPKTSGRKPN